MTEHAAGLGHGDGSVDLAAAPIDVAAPSDT